MIFFKHPPEDLEFVGDCDLDKPYNEIIRRCLRLKSAVSVTEQQRLILMPLIIEGLISDVGGKLLPVMLIDLFEMSEARAEAGRKGGKSRKSLKREANDKQIESKIEANGKQDESKQESSEEQKQSKCEADKIRKEEIIKEQKEQYSSPSASVADAPKKRTPKDPDEILAKMRTLEIYKNLDFDMELGKAQAWCLTHSRKCSPQFFTNWLGRALENGAIKNSVSQSINTAYASSMNGKNSDGSAVDYGRSIK